MTQNQRHILTTAKHTFVKKKTLLQNDTPAHDTSTRVGGVTTATATAAVAAAATDATPLRRGIHCKLNRNTTTNKNSPSGLSRRGGGTNKRTQTT